MNSPLQVCAFAADLLLFVGAISIAKGGEAAPFGVAGQNCVLLGE
jgi:hypothetical protein